MSFVTIRRKPTKNFSVILPVIGLIAKYFEYHKIITGFLSTADEIRFSSPSQSLKRGLCPSSFKDWRQLGRSPLVRDVQIFTLTAAPPYLTTSEKGSLLLLNKKLTYDPFRLLKIQQSSIDWRKNEAVTDKESGSKVLNDKRLLVCDSFLSPTSWSWSVVSPFFLFYDTN